MGNELLRRTNTENDQTAPKQSDWLQTCSNTTDFNDLASLLIGEIHSSINRGESALANPADYSSHYSPQDGEEFDFVVVGSGSAGSVIANRLSEIPEWKILLIEAGGDPTKTTEIPALYGMLQQTKIDWQYQSDPEEDNCLGMVNNSCNWPRGKVLGGSSTTNGNLYVRGNPKDYDEWSAAGNEGWDYKNVLPYFKKSEDMRSFEIINNTNYGKYHGKSGYLSVDSWKDHGIKEIVKAFSSGLMELGYNKTNDCNGESQIGYAKLQGTISHGKRCSTAKAFLKPVRDKKNLKLSKNSLVTKILIDKKHKTVHGVRMLLEDKEINVIVKKEVIVSGGAVNSPQLLMLSGIGPKQHLEDQSIDLIEDLPVGENLQDHLLMVGLLLSFNYTREVKPLTQHMYEFLTQTSSKFSSVGLLSHSAFINTLNSSNNYPDVQILLVDFDAGSFDSLSTTLNMFGIREDIAKEYHEINARRFMVMIMPALLKPEARGRILLESKNPKNKPKIVCGYFSDGDKDVETLTEAIQFISKLASTEEMKKLDAKFHEISPPACKKYTVSSKEFRKCTLKHLTTSTYHPTSTCKMGPLNDPTAVVNSNLQVRGVKRLRVADASIMPSITRGNTNAPTIMIGEKAADLIKDDWLSQNL